MGSGLLPSHHLADCLIVNSLVKVIKFVKGVEEKEQRFRGNSSGKQARLCEDVWFNEHQSKFKKRKIFSDNPQSEKKKWKVKLIFVLLDQHFLSQQPHFTQCSIENVR